MVSVPNSFVLVAVPLLLQVLPGQRDDQVLKTKVGRVVVSYGVVPLGRHGLHELTPGDTWRMGLGSPSTLTTHLPLLHGDEIVAPGSYQTQIYRAEEEDLRLTLSGGGGTGRGMGRRGGGGTGGRGRGNGGRGTQLEARLSTQRKTSKKLKLAWVKSKKKVQEASAVGADDTVRPGVQESVLRIDFGVHRLQVPMTFVRATSHRVRGFQGLGFTYPVDLFQARIEADKATTVFALIPKGKREAGAIPGYNVVVAKDSAAIAPMTKAPQGRGRRGGGGGRGRGGQGRGGRDAAPLAQTLNGEVEWSTHQGEGSDTVVIKSVKVTKKMLHFEIVAGNKFGRVTVPLPVIKKK